MKIRAEYQVNLKIDEVIKAAGEAARLAMRDTVVEIYNESIHGSPARTGHNRRSLASEVSGMGTVAEGVDAETERVVDDSRVEGAVYSTSGYGGYLETGTVKMAARPYMKPAIDRNFTSEAFAEKMEGHLK